MQPYQDRIKHEFRIVRLADCAAVPAGLLRLSVHQLDDEAQRSDFERRRPVLFRDSQSEINAPEPCADPSDRVLATRDTGLDTVTSTRNIAIRRIRLIEIGMLSQQSEQASVSWLTQPVEATGTHISTVTSKLLSYEWEVMLCNSLISGC
jgi:hypothetical protein